MNKFCSECGAKLGPDAKFCPQCGTASSGTGKSQSRVIASKSGKSSPRREAPGQRVSPPSKAVSKNQYLLLFGVGFIALLVAILYHYYEFVETVENKTQQTVQQSSQAAQQGAGNNAHEHQPPSQEQIDAIVNAVKADPNNAELNTHAGNILFDASRFNDAIPYYNKSLELAPGNPDVLVDLGVCYFNLEDYQKAGNYFSQALEVNPNHVNALYNAGVVAVQTGDMPGLINYWTQLQQVAPNSAQAQRASQILEQIHQNAQQQPGS